MVDIYKPRLFQQIYNQQKEFEEAVTPAQYVDLNSDTNFLFASLSKSFDH